MKAKIKVRKVGKAKEQMKRIINNKNEGELWRAEELKI